MIGIVRILLLAALLWVPKSQALADTLVFVHSPGCMYCEMWRSDVLPMYHKTEEGKRLPLREVNLDQGMPDDLKHLLYPTFTPTFIVLDDSKNEVGRILGYSEEFFWGYLEAQVAKLGPPKKS